MKIWKKNEWSRIRWDWLMQKSVFFFFYEKKIMNEKDSNFLKNLNKRIKKYDTWNLN